jgi:uridine phosphorylase
MDDEHYMRALQDAMIHIHLESDVLAAMIVVVPGDRRIKKIADTFFFYFVSSL